MAHLGHLALYANICVVLITGVLMMDKNINVFNLFFIPHPLEDVQLLAFLNACMYFLVCLYLYWL